jgi:hypothetical protein
MKIHSDLRTRLLSSFPELSKLSHDSYLFLSKYLDASPTKFFDRELYAELETWLSLRDNSDGATFLQYTNDNNAVLSNALMHLEEINAMSWHSNRLPDDDVDQLKFIDQVVHPAYLRLTEGVLTILLHPVAYFSRLDRSKNTDGLDIWNIVEELKFTSLHNRIVGYDNLMRNGIAHGGITYLEREIKYKDKRGNEGTIDAPDVLRKFDDLLDVCNSLALAFSLFIFLNEPKGYVLPPHTLYEELRVSTKTPYWEVIACIPTETMKGSQLVVYAKANTSDCGKVHASAIQTGILAAFLSTGYDRYFVSIRSRNALPGWAAFDGKKLSNLAKRDDVSVQDFAGVLEDGLVFYVPRVKLPRILSRLNTFLISLKIHVSLAKAEFHRNLGLPIIEVRNVSLHRDGWRAVLKGEVVIFSRAGDIESEEIYSSLRRITRRAAKKARRGRSLFNVIRHLPLGLVYLSVFNRDYRQRRLSGFGLGPDLICTIRIDKTKRNKSPDISGATIEERGKYRIAWNRQWLDNAE